MAHGTNRASSKEDKDKRRTFPSTLFQSSSGVKKIWNYKFINAPIIAFYLELATGEKEEEEFLTKLRKRQKTGFIDEYGTRLLQKEARDDCYEVTTPIIVR